MKAPRPLTDSDFSLLIPGKVKDGEREPSLGFAPGSKNPSIIAPFLRKDGKRFSQAFMGFIPFFKFLNEIEALIRFPGTEKIAKTFVIERASGGGKVIPSGTTVTASRRADGVVSIRMENREIREAIFPLVFPRGLTVETRIESGEPRDPRETYIMDALTYIEMIRAAGYEWKHEITSRGNEEMRDQLKDSSNWG